MTGPTTPERCPFHPDLEPIQIVVNRIRSAQADHPTRLVVEWRCPICR